jgi:uncharacterized protein
MASVTLTQIAGHPAPWPLLDLDVAAIRQAGHEPVPFSQFILKVNSRCNLSCSYCYVYEMTDQAWRDMPIRMSHAVAAKTAERIGNHAERHGLEAVDVILHGGEPLLAGADWLADLVTLLRDRVPATVNVSVQTNGTLLSRPMLETLKRLRVNIGVSLDGDAEATGRHRRYANGRNSFNVIAEGLDLLRSPEFRDCYGGLLCTIDTGNDPVATYEALLKFSPPAIDLLLPHANWSSAPPGSRYADWLIAVFDRWYSAPRQETQIRLFGELIQLVLGQPGAVEGLGLLPSTLVVVDTDGSIKQLDSLSSSYPGAADTGLHVFSSGFDGALDHPTTVARQIGAAALAAQCLDCPVMEICGGGLYPHRYREGAGFRNPSVYCDDLLGLITHVRNRLVADLSRLKALRRHRLDFGGQARPLLGHAGLGVLQGQGLLVFAEGVVEPAIGIGLVTRGPLVNGQVGGRQQRVRVSVAKRAAALVERLAPELDGLAQPLARGEVRSVVDAGRQRERMKVTVGPDEAVHCLTVVDKGISGASLRAEHGSQVQLRREEKILRRAGFLAAAVCLAG